jgi:ATP phosphoribosyltransferase regulatory subunit HisZ
MAISLDESAKARETVRRILGQEAISDADLEVLKKNLGAAGQFGSTDDNLALRAQVELIAAIRRFDKGNEAAQVRLFEAIRHFDDASGDMAEANLDLGRKVKTLTVWGVIFAALGVGLAAGSLYVSWLALKH